MYRHVWEKIVQGLFTTYTYKEPNYIYHMEEDIELVYCIIDIQLILWSDKPFHDILKRNGGDFRWQDQKNIIFH